MNWIEIPAGKYKLLSEEAKRTTCQIEVNVRYDTRVLLCWRLLNTLKVGRIHLALS